MRSYTVKESTIGSAVSEILRYRQADRQTDILFYYKDTSFPHVIGKLKQNVNYLFNDVVKFSTEI